ncbi:MAG: hypothetical protein V1833_00825 [Elusimicrobiota bacterium]
MGKMDFTMLSLRESEATEAISNHRKTEIASLVLAMTNVKSLVVSGL